MSCPQHVGDLIIPHPLGHFATWTLSPDFVVMLSLTNEALHLLHVKPLTPIPHLLHVHCMILSFEVLNLYLTSQRTRIPYAIQSEILICPGVGSFALTRK